MQPHPGAEEEEGEVAEEAGALIMEEVMVKEVTALFCSQRTLCSGEKVIMIDIVSKQHIKCVLSSPVGFGTYGYGNSANSGYSKYSFHPF